MAPHYHLTMTGVYITCKFTSSNSAWRFTLNASNKRKPMLCIWLLNSLASRQTGRNSLRKSTTLQRVPAITPVSTYLVFGTVTFCAPYNFVALILMLLLLTRSSRHIQQQVPGLPVLLCKFASNATKEAVERAVIVDTLAQVSKGCAWEVRRFQQHAHSPRPPVPCQCANRCFGAGKEAGVTGLYTAAGRGNDPVLDRADNSRSHATL